MGITEIDQSLLLGAVALVLGVLLIAFRAQVKDMVRQQLTSVRRTESQMLKVTAAMSEEIQLQPLLVMVMATVSDILDADRSTLFLHDPVKGELWSTVAEGMGEFKDIRFPSNLGIAGTVFTTGETVNIKEAYSDERFNKAIDKKTGYRTRNMLCMQVVNRHGKPIGAVQALNKANVPFTVLDERRLKAFAAQAAISIENAQLFDEVVTVKNYTEAMLESMRSGVISTDAEGVMVRANAAALRLLGATGDASALLGVDVREYFVGRNEWLAQSVGRALGEGDSDEALDATLTLGDEVISVNAKAQPLTNAEGDNIGCLMIIEDISAEKRLRSTMSRYMSKELADKLLEAGEQALGGTLQVASVLFSDIRSFTGFSERNGPQETVEMLNKYFTAMYDRVTGHGGILDKYIGDAIMAVFGAPFPGPRDADNAVHSAVAMMQALVVFNEERAAEGKEPISIGVGVNTDEVVSGNIGSTKRMDYTVIGDGVNLAARLEGVTKTYGTPVLLSEFTVEALTEAHRLREVDLVRVKGKEKPVAIYEAVDALAQADRDLVAGNAERHGAGLTAYRAQEWDSAQAHFEACLERHSTDRVSQMYLERIAHFRAQPPAPEWDGVWTMTSK